MLDRVLPRGSSARSAVFGVAGFLVVALVTRLMPNSSGTVGTPLAILFLGLILGSLNALVAAGIILIYRSSRIINFAQGSIGGAGGAMAYNLAVSQTTRFPFILAFLIGVITAGLVGAIIEIAFVRRFFNAPRLVLTVVTIAMIGALGFAVGQVNRLPIFGDFASRSTQEIGGTAPVPVPFDSFQFEIGDLPLRFGFIHIFSVVMVALALLGMAAFLKFTKAGIATRASSENSDRAMLLGINVKGLSTIVWTVTGMLSGVGVILKATIGQSFAGVGIPQPEVFLSALAAAIFGRMRNLPVATASAIGLEVVRQAVSYNLPDQVLLFNVVLFVLILVSLLLQRKQMTRSELGDSSAWQATEEHRAIPKEMMEVSGVRTWRRVMIALGIITVLGFPWISSTGPTVLVGSLALSTIAILSLVVLTGWTGQVSLGQWALVAFAAIIGAALTAKVEISFWIALPITCILTAGVAVLIGLPALRIKGLYLAVTTAAFAYASQVFFDPKLFGWLLADAVDRPTLFLIDFDDERSMYYLCIFSLMLTVLLVTTLRKSRPGRVLIALRENENNAQSFGVNVVRMKLMAFALSGFLCGFAGFLFAHHQRAISRQAYPADESLDIFIFAVIGGIGSVPGALLGGLYLTLSRVFGGNPFLQLVIGPIGLLFLLYVAPSGLGGIFFSIRDSILRIVAQRRQMVVPALFADMDPEAVERKLAPLAEPIPGVGLVSLPYEQRYQAPSDMYRARGKLKVKSASRDDSKAMAAAAKGFEAADEARAGELVPVAGVTDEH